MEEKIKKQTSKTILNPEPGACLSFVRQKGVPDGF